MIQHNTLNVFQYLGIVTLAAFYSITLFAQEKHKHDSLQIYSIPEVIISENYHTQELRASMPTQILTNKELKRLNVLQVSDAVKHFAGITVKDYGGIGGLKTVSLRSLGASHTTIGYDGIALSDVQTGQIDIGRFSLDNVDRLSLSNGQSDNIFQPARFFSSAGILNIQTLTPHFNKRKKNNFSSSLKSGSWGLINPSFRIEQQINKKWAASLNSEWMSADGRYPYILRYGGANDSTSHEKRKNTEVQTLRTEAELFGNFSNSEQWRLKVYYYQSSRGLPAATTLYYDYASQHLWDKNFFAQSRYKKNISKRWAIQASAKWNWAYQKYLDPDYKGSEGKTENTYYQTEYYISGTALYRVIDNFSFSLSTDGSINSLNANLNDFVGPTRYSLLTAFAGKYINEWLTASASLLSTVINEKTHSGQSAKNHRKISSNFSLSIKPMNDEDFYLRFFYKNSFRLPSFNDLYYGQIGNRTLLPEKTSQYNLGITYSKEISQFISYLSASIDGYYNKVDDKIIATPTKNIFVWSMVNLGKVEIKGIDITARIILQPYEKIRFNFSGNYTYQEALDVTRPEDKTYKNQIAYTPRISGSGQAGIETPWVNVSYSFLSAGKRYMLGQNISDNRLAGYSDQSISVNREFLINKVRTSLSLEILNLNNKNYEIVKNFPMPGRSIRATIKINY